MRPLLACAASIVALGVPAAAPAATVSTETRCQGSPGSCLTTASFTAAPGEANDVAAEQGDGEVRFRDRGAPIEVGDGCRRLADGAAACPAGAVTVRLGDGDDRLALGAHAFAFSGLGEDGDDELRGSPGGERLEGGPGDDRLFGEAGHDALDGGSGADLAEGGEGDDRIELADIDQYAVQPAAPASGAGVGSVAGPPAPDRADGGPGEDSLDYRPERRALHVDLATGAAGGTGAAAAGDVLSGLENLLAGSGHDRLAGDDGPNAISAGEGDDLVAGRGGDDELADEEGNRGSIDGGAGDDALSAAGPAFLHGGDGDDLLTTGPGGGVAHGGAGADRVTLPEPPRAPLRVVCGDGADTAAAQRRVWIAGDCEWVALGTGGAAIGRPLRLRGRSALVPLRAPEGVSGRLVVRDARTGRPLGSGRFSGAGAETTPVVRVGLTDAAVRRVLRRGAIAATVLDAREPSARLRTAIVAAPAATLRP
ncbi:MAG TPA: calcium-binding protein [Solirubrobacteraceae bacterium]|nr:calcium-binding protein [Solirubrobacteraceae bacterium]